MRQIVSPWRAIGVFVPLHVLFFGRFVFLGQYLYWGDTILQFWPWRHFMRELMLDGRLPLWNPYTFGGLPFAANPQVGLFYPPNLLTFSLPAHAWVTWSAILHVGLAGSFMILFLSSLGRSPAAQLLGAIAYAWSGCVIARLQFANHLISFAALPALLWVCHAQAVRPPRQVVGVAVIVALMLLGGHVQINMLALAVVAISLGGESQRRAKLLRLLCGCCFGVLLSAVQWLPGAELTLNSSRTTFTGVSARAFALPPWQQIVWLLPDFFGNPQRSSYWGEGNFFEASPYVGLVPLLLAAQIPLRSGPLRVWWGIAIVGSLLAMGYYAPFYPTLIGAVPILHVFRGAGRWLIWPVVSLSVLSAASLDELIANVTAQRRVGRMAAGLALCCLTLTVIALAIPDSVARALSPALRSILQTTYKDIEPRAAVHLAVMSIPVATALLLALAGAIRLQCPPELKCTMLVGLGVVDLFLFGSQLNPGTRAETFAVRSPLPSGSRVASSQAFLKAAWNSCVNYSQFRTASWRTGDDSSPLLWCVPNTNMVSGIYDVAGYENLRLRARDQRLGNLEQSAEVSAYGALGAEAVLELNKNERALQLRRVFAVQPRAEGLLSRSALKVVDRINVLSIEANESFLLRDSGYPGWRVFSEARPVAIETDGLFRRVDSARGIVQLVFASVALQVGLAISLLTLAGFAAWCTADLLQQYNPNATLP